MSNYFNNILAPSWTLDKKPSFKDVYDSFINKQNKNNTIINESVFKQTLFENLYNHIKQHNQLITIFSTEQLKDFFQPNSKVFKILRKNNNTNNYKLCVVYGDFSTKEKVYDILTEVCNDSIKFDKFDAINIFYSLKHAKGMFTPFNQNKQLSMLWVKQDSTIEYFQHEFIHYLEWIGKCYGQNIQISKLDENLWFEGQESFKQLFELQTDDFNYIFNKHEYQTLLNDFLNKLQQLKIDYFNDLDGNHFARMICYKLLRDSSKTVEQYLQQIKSFEYFDQLKPFTSYSFPMIVGYNCLNYKIPNIKNHIYGLFN